MPVRSVVLNGGLETIGFGTFRNSKIKKIVIPKTVTEIDGRAFEDCASLGGVVFEERIMLKKLGDYAFSWCRSLRNILLPDGLESIEMSCF